MTEPKRQNTTDFKNIPPLMGFVVRPSSYWQSLQRPIDGTSDRTAWSSSRGSKNQTHGTIRNWCFKNLQNRQLVPVPPLLVEKEWLPFDTPPKTSAETCGEALIRNPIRLEVNGASHSIRLSLCRKQLVTACIEHNVTNILPHRNPTQGNNNKIESKLKNTHRNLGQRGWRRSRR